MVAKKRLMQQWKRGAHGNTYGGNPARLRGGASRRSTWSKREYAANAARVGAAFHGPAARLMRDYPCIGEVRGKGLMIGMELVENDAERHARARAVRRVVTRAFHNGLLLLSCGASTVRFMPPLSVSIEEVDEAIGLLRTALDEALQGKAA